MLRAAVNPQFKHNRGVRGVCVASYQVVTAASRVG